jgi:hypothetical protein
MQVTEKSYQFFGKYSDVAYIIKMKQFGKTYVCQLEDFVCGTTTLTHTGDDIVWITQFFGYESREFERFHDAQDYMISCAQDIWDALDVSERAIGWGYSVDWDVKNGWTYKVLGK